MTEKASRQSIGEWLASRVPLAHFGFEQLKQKTVPGHRFRFAYYLGGLTLCALLIQIVTGALLMLYYQPTTVGANQSIQYIMRLVPGGAIMRNVHAWAANALVVFVFLHASSVALLRSYRSPREFTWISGALSLLIVLAMAFSGYLLPWSMLSVYATKVGTEIMQASTNFLPGPVSGAGAWAASLITGGEIGQMTLTRFYAFHVVILPLLLMLLAGAHLLLIQLHGMSVPASVVSEKGPAERFFPVFFVRELGLWLFFLCALVVVACILPYDSFMPYTLSAPFSPTAPAPVGIKPEWYFYFLYYPLEMMPREIAIAGAILFFAFLVLFPFVAAAAPRLWGASSTTSRFPTVVSSVVILVIVVLTLFGADLVKVMRGP